MAGVFMESDAKRRVIRISVWVAVLAMLLVVVSSLATALSASAHAALKSMTPAEGSTVRQAPKQVVLEFNEPISTTFATVTITGPDGASVAKGNADVSGATVTQAVSEDLSAGGYMVAFRVVSKDGHPISDKKEFTLALPATTSSTAAPTSVTPDTATTSAPVAAPSSAKHTTAHDEGGSSVPMWALLAVAVVALGGLGLALRGRGRGTH
jgi:copper resistance protein C